MEYLIIQVTEKLIKTARFGISGRTLSFAGSSSFELDEQHGITDITAKIAETVIGSPRVVLCLPANLFAQREVELPLKDLRKVREIMPTHLQGELALPPEEVIFDVLPSRDGKYMAFWIKRSEVERAIVDFKEVGLEPSIVTSATFAWPFLPGIPVDCALCDGAALALVDGGKLSYVRAFGAVDQSQELINTISALEFSERRLPDQLLVFGPQASELNKLASLKIQASQLEEPAEFSHLFSNRDSFNQLAEIFAVAKACQSGSLPNFRRGDLVWTAGVARLHKKMLLTAILSGIVVLLLFGFKFMQYRQARSDLASLNTSIFKIYREIFPGRTKAVDELAEIKGEIRKLGGSDSFSGILDILKKVADAKGSTINGLYELEVEGRALAAKGDARSAQSVNDFKTALIPLVTTVELGEVKSRPDGTVTFSLNATLKEGNK